MKRAPMIVKAAIHAMPMAITPKKTSAHFSGACPKKVEISSPNTVSTSHHWRALNTTARAMVAAASLYKNLLLKRSVSFFSIFPPVLSYACPASIGCRIVFVLNRPMRRPSM